MITQPLTHKQIEVLLNGITDDVPVYWFGDITPKGEVIEILERYNQYTVTIKFEKELEIFIS